MHLAFITMLIWEDDAAGVLDSHKACRMSVGFLPLFNRGTLLGRRLAKKAMIKMEVNEFNIVLGCRRVDGQRKNHRQFFPGIERHAIDQKLATLVSGTRKDVCGMDRADGLRQTTHNPWAL